jgi:dethiobiotin synthetase
MLKGYFISGTGTGVGKTLASVILCRYFGFHYWKPVQTGTSESSDLTFVKNFLSDKINVKIYPCVKEYPEPLSPHYAAELHQDVLQPETWKLPDTNNNTLLVEGAGGILVPLNENTFMYHLALMWNIPVIMVVRNYLGCINHSLLSFQFLLNKNVPVKGIILNGNFDEPVRRILLRHCPFSLLAEIPEMHVNSKEDIDRSISEGKIQFYQTL